MIAQTRDAQVASTFVTLAETLVGDYDMVDVLQTLVEQASGILESADGGILLPNGFGDLEVVASTSERSHLISLLQLRADEGPCVDAYETGEFISVDDIAATTDRWPTFARGAAGLGYRSMCAIPMRFRDQTIGSLNLFSTHDGPLPEADVIIATALAQVATVSILHEGALRDDHLAKDQLERALDSWVVIEQAKGVLAHTEQVDMDEAFALLRTRARDTGRRLSVAAQEIIDTAMAS